MIVITEELAARLAWHPPLVAPEEWVLRILEVWGMRFHYVHMEQDDPLPDDQVEVLFVELHEDDTVVPHWRQK